MPKPYYEENGISLYHGNCRDILPTLGPVDLVLTDPPYGANIDVRYSKFTDGHGKSTGTDYENAVIGDDAPFDPAPLMAYPKVILWGANCFSNRLPMGNWLIWDKRTSPDQKQFLPSDGEAAWMKAGSGGKQGGNGVRIFTQRWQGFMRDEQRHGHPTQKPIGLMGWCLKQARLPDFSLVLDPYAGVGSTLVACRRNQQNAIGIEIEERYLEIAANRLRQSELFGL